MTLPRSSIADVCRPGAVRTPDAGGSVALISGGGRGLGRLLARTLAGQGAAVALIARSGDDLRAFTVYGNERAERMRRVRTVARIAATLFAQFGADAQRLRMTAMTRMAEDPNLALWRASIGLGPDAVPDLIFEETFSDRLLAA